MNINELHSIFLDFNLISTDTRKIEKDCIFFALKGDNFNGNKFASEAISKGAKFAIIDEKEFNLNSNFILVDNVLSTLQELANYHRNYLGLKIIGLTGSNGKTTTKELINSALRKRYKTIATSGNLNNHIGVPLTLLRMDKTTEIGIVEMGANHLNEIEFLCRIAEPDYGYITNFGKAHLEGFGSEKGVIKGKSELYDYLKTNNNQIFINNEDPIQLKQLGDYLNFIKFGLTDNVIKIDFIEANPFVSVLFNNYKIKSNLIGSYNFTNISAAIAIGNYFKVTDTNIKDAIESYTPENNRSQIITRNSNKIILDAYNANPTSMKAALDSLSYLKDSKKIAILGDMFELGESSKKEHQAIAEYALSLNIDLIYLVGSNFYSSQIDDKLILYYQTYENLKRALQNTDFKNLTILIKGSRGMTLERILNENVI
jgi:UDP-N-acetylmuramoyl-tripeptide--D-alanyl-D-alanine ligase